MDPLFKQQIKGKNLYYPNNKNEPKAEIDYDHIRDTLGEINIWFVDELARQIGKQLVQIAGKELDNRWSIEVSDHFDTVVENGVSYRRVWLKNRFAEAIGFCVGWKENYKISDYVTADDIHFFISETAPVFKPETTPPFKPASFQKIAKFIQVGGFEITPEYAEELRRYAEKLKKEKAEYAAEQKKKKQ